MNKTLTTEIGNDTESWNPASLLWMSASFKIHFCSYCSIVLFLLNLFCSWLQEISAFCLEETAAHSRVLLTRRKAPFAASRLDVPNWRMDSFCIKPISYLFHWFTIYCPPFVVAGIYYKLLSLFFYIARKTMRISIII